MKLLRSHAFAWIVGSLVVLVVAVVAFNAVGWSGIGVLGVLGLFVSQRLEMNDGVAVNSAEHGADSVRLLAQIQRVRDARTPSEKAAAAAAERASSRLRYILNTFWIAMAVLGFGMLFGV